MAFYTASASIFFVYAVMIATQSQRGNVRIFWLFGIFAIVILPAILGYVSWFFSAGCMLFGPLVAVATMTNSRLEDQNVELIETRAEMRNMAITAERERIARDMHDTLGHVLSVITAKADLAQRVIDTNPIKAKQEMKEVHKTGRQALRQIRDVIAGLENTTIATELAHARYLLETANIHVEITNISQTLTPSYQHALGMMIREATTNIVKHAGATRCQIGFQHDATSIYLRISDNGSGKDFEPKAGLSNINFRADQLGGAYDIKSKSGQGTVLNITLPK